jgi:PAS domain S-box-containing protein
MVMDRTGSAAPAYRRLSERQARRSLSAVVPVCVLMAGLALVGQVLRAVGPPAIAFGSILTLAFVLVGWLIARGPSRLITTGSGALGLVALLSAAGSQLLSPLLPPSLTVGFTGLIPIGMAVFALWDLTAHLIWLAVATVLLVAILLLGQGTADVGAIVGPALVAWMTGAVFSLLAQQALERGRITIFQSARRAHAARGAAATTLRQLQAVEAIGRSLSERGPTRETLAAAMQMLVDSFGYVHPSIYLGDDQVIHLGAQMGYDGLMTKVEREAGIIGRVMRTHQPVLLADVTTDPDYRRIDPHDRSEICVPLLAGDRLLGVLNVESAYELGPDDLARASIIADRLAAALDLAERRDTLERFLEASPLAIAAFAADGTVVYWNRAASELYGWSAEEVIGGVNPVSDGSDPIGRTLIEEVTNGRAVSGIDALRRHRDGHQIPVRIHAAPIGERPPYGMIGVYQDLTAERAASEALSESEARFGTIVGALREGVIVQDVDLNVLWTNPAVERLLGMTAERFTGRETWADGWHVVGDSSDPIERRSLPGVHAVRTGQPVLGVTLGVRSPEGTTRWLEADAVLLRRASDEGPYAVVTSLSDVTDRKHHEDELAAAELQVRSVLEQAANPIVGVGMDGRITFANRRTEEVFGWPAGELVGQPVEVLVPDDVAGNHAQLREAFLVRPTPRRMGLGLDLIARRRDGTTLPVEISISPVETPVGRQVFATIVDATERRRIDAELLQAAKLESIGRLAGGIAHDFNNLLTAIIGYGEIAMADLPADGPVRGEVGEMVKAAERASDLTRQLLGFARKTMVVPATHELNAIIIDLAPFLGRLLGERIALVTNLDPSTGHVRVDRSQVDQVLVNLAVNARDAMPDGGTLLIETTSLGADDVDAVLGVTGDPIAVLTVSDTGLGMSEETRARIFEPFFTTKPFGEGTGLGLATTYGIVHSVGGAITVDSAIGAGTTFRIYLPESAPAPVAEQPGDPAVPEAGTARTILVVEDEESVRSLATRILERAGYHVLQAPNGAAAVSLVGTRLAEVDVLLSDIVMPGMRGPELYEVLRAARPGLPAVFMSGYAAGEAGATLVPDGCTLLAKPFTTEALLAAVAKA